MESGAGTEIEVDFPLFNDAAGEVEFLPTPSPNKESEFETMPKFVIEREIPEVGKLTPSNCKPCRKSPAAC